MKGTREQVGFQFGIKNGYSRGICNIFGEIVPVLDNIVAKFCLTMFGFMSRYYQPTHP